MATTIASVAACSARGVSRLMFPAISRFQFTIVKGLHFFFTKRIFPAGKKRGKSNLITNLFFAFLLDGIDGLLARRFNNSNNIGSFIDTLGDRITENIILVFLAYKKLIPLFIPVVFISRSFIADFIRS